MKEKHFKAQQEVALHPELFDSKRSSYMSVFSLIYTEFSETTEKVFSSNIETFNTLGNANFVHDEEVEQEKQTIK